MSDLSVMTVSGASGEPLVQMIVVTINGTQYALVGPVVHVPGLTAQELDISEVEFGEIMPAHAAARMLEGDFRAIMGYEIQ